MQYFLISWNRQKKKNADPAKQFSTLVLFICVILEVRVYIKTKKKKISYREAHGIVDLDSIPISKRNFFFFSVILIDIKLEKTTVATEFR